MSDNRLIPDEDFEYERQLAEKERMEREDRQAAEEQAEKDRIKAEREKEKKRQEQINRDRVELMKLKNGVIESSDTITEEHDQIRELHGVEKVQNIWYHYKIPIIFATAMAAAVAYMIYDALSRTKPDLTVLLIANNGLEYRTEELEEFFEKYTDDENGDGKVYVQIIAFPLNSNSSDMSQTSNQAKFMAQLQTADNLFVIADSNTDEDFLGILYHDFPKDYPDNKYMTENGLSLNFGFFARDIKYESMPYDVVLGLRAPIKTLKDSQEKMQENFDKDVKIFEAISEDLAKTAEETGDTGLKTPPANMKKNDDSSQAEASSEQ